MPSAPELPRQCAWCQRLTGAAGRFSIQASTLLRDVAHRICPACTAAWLAEMAAEDGETPNRAR